MSTGASPSVVPSLGNICDFLTFSNLGHLGQVQFIPGSKCLLPGWTRYVAHQFLKRMRGELVCSGGRWWYCSLCWHMMTPSHLDENVLQVCWPNTWLSLWQYSGCINFSFSQTHFCGSTLAFKTIFLSQEVSLRSFTEVSLWACARLNVYLHLIPCLLYKIFARRSTEVCFRHLDSL
jgi:hypothetical protein